MNNYKYGIIPKELKEVRKYIIQDIKSNNYVENPIENMTLQDYFDIIKECMLAFIDENGVVHDMFGETWNSEIRKQDIRKLKSKDVSEIWQDGRGLFSIHGNINNYDIKYGEWSDIGKFEDNQWYHEDRLNDKWWFKQCIDGGIGSCGHPTENLMISNINPVEYEKNKWCISFGTFSRSDFGVLKAYLHLKNKKIPAFIYGAQNYLTPKQINKLVEEGFLKEKDYTTGYWI